MKAEQIATESFVNNLNAVEPGFSYDPEVPAMATPATPAVTTNVVQGSTICLLC